jgi:ferrous iron transport protein B
MSFTVALAGNPNVGKSTIFNALTGSQQHVGNWPGKTVEKKEGRLRFGSEDIFVIDLPGTYSLTAYSIEEIIARDYIVHEHPSAVVVVVDASNLERNLYLVAQIIELKIPVIIALNMADLATSRGMSIDVDELSSRLGGIPIVRTVGNRRRGIDELKEIIAQVATNPRGAELQVEYTGVIRDEILSLEDLIGRDEPLTKAYDPHWLAIKLLEADPGIDRALIGSGMGDLVSAADEARARIEEKTGEEADTIIADQRYSFIGSVIDYVVVRPRETVFTGSDRIDRIVTHKVWGIPIFLLTMWVIFQFTANVSAPYLDWIDVFFNEVVYGWAQSLMVFLGLGGTWFASLVTDGMIAGLGGVLVFIPVLLFLYLALAVLEDSGYMSRAAFVMDRVMRWMGLHGKSFLPMIVGFGCTVPAVYATRTLQNEKDRKLTGFLATFMSCGARLPVYVVFGTAFFGSTSGNLIFAMYLLGIAIALAIGFTLKHTVYKGKPPAPFVMELPPYRLPRGSDVWRHMWMRTKGFVIKAGTVILFTSIVLWFLMAIPAGSNMGTFNNVPAEDSVFGALSGVVAPALAPAGFGTWEASGSLITGFVAKEVIVGTMNQIYVQEARDAEPVGEDEVVDPTTFGEDLVLSVVGFGEAAILTVQEVINIVPRTINIIPGIHIGEVAFFLETGDVEENTSSLQAALVTSFSASAGSVEAGMVAAVAFTVFVLLYVPCMAAVSAMRQEFGSRWMWTQIAFTLALAWVASVLVFQTGKLLIL